ncbi:MAG: Ig-like domain repeat protein [Kiritimatiellae bacterium]|nr:Ig-like domain repeat protein [Kiritimatiellia bacterium]
MRFSRFMVWAAAAVWGVSAAFGGEVRFSGIEVKMPANPAAKGAAPGVTMRGEGTANEAYELQWTPSLGADADWRSVGNATAGDDGRFAVDAFGSAGFFRMALPGSKGGVADTIEAARDVILNRLTEIRTSTNIVQAFDTSFYVEATLSTLVLSGSGRSGQPLAGQSVKFEINGGTWVQNTDENGQVRFGPFVHWPIRTSTGTIRFEGAQGLSPCSESVTVAITKADSRITISSTNLIVRIRPARKLGICLKDSHNAGLTNQTVTMLIDGKTFTLRTDGQGRTTWYPQLRAGTYQARISFAGSATHKPASRTVMLHLAWAVQIGAPNKTFNVSSRKKRYTVCFKDYTGKALANEKVRIKILRKTYTLKTNAKGRASVNIASLRKGTYKIVVYFTGNSRYWSLNKTATITVLGSQATQLAVPNKTYFSSEPNKRYTVTLRTQNEVLEKEILTFKINGKRYAKKTNAKGRAILRLPGLKTGVAHKITVLYAGRGGYKASQKTAKVTIIATKLLPNLAADNMTYSIDAANRRYTATLKAPNGQVLQNETVTFTINGQTYSKKTNVQGHAVISIPNLAEGVHSMVVRFPGNTYYKAASKTVEITITQ